jgi:hypothetical protein
MEQFFGIYARVQDVLIELVTRWYKYLCNRSRSTGPKTCRSEKSEQVYNLEYNLESSISIIFDFMCDISC